MKAKQQEEVSDHDATSGKAIAYQLQQPAEEPAERKLAFTPCLLLQEAKLFAQRSLLDSRILRYSASAGRFLIVTRRPGRA